MFISFIAIIVVLLVIVSIFSIQGTQSGTNADYYAEAVKVRAMLSLINSESNFYYLSNDESYKNFSVSYYRTIDFDQKRIDSTTNSDIDSINDGKMNANDWLGLVEDYEGDYIKLGGPAGDYIRIVIEPNSDGKSYIIRICGLDLDGDGKIDNVDPAYTKILDDVLSRSENYFTG